MKTWLVCGGREFGKLPTNSLNFVDKKAPEYHQKLSEYLFIMNTLDKLSIERSECYNPDDNWLPSDIKIIHGGATGADDCADQWAVVNWCQVKEYPAEWNKYGKKAGYIRNHQMLVEGKPDLVIAFPGGKGTKMMVDIAKKAGVEVIEVKYENSSII